MKKLEARRLAATAVVILAPLVLLIVTANLSDSVSAREDRVRGRLAAQSSERRMRQARLKAELSSSRSQSFREALAELASLDEQGALDLWQAALKNGDPELQKEAWRKYGKARAGLARKEIIAQVVRVNARSDELIRLADSAGLELTVWAEGGGETIAAMPAYLLEALRGAGLEARLLYDSIADWQRARARGDVAAQAITPEYQSERVESQSQIRIAVIDLARRSAPAEGYSDWLGDGENILMRSESFLAYMDIFQSDGSADAVSRRIQEQYTRRGYKLAGFYTPEEFSRAVSRFFPGKRFDAGKRPDDKTNESEIKSNEVGLALAEGRFHSYEETLSEFRQLANSNPSLARLVVLGTSYEGRQIFALKISKDATTDDSTKPDVLITGCYHAREWISVEPPVYFANKLVNDYAVDDSIKHLVDNLQIWIVPIVNPDGLTYSQRSANNVMNTFRLWRKNRRPVSAGECGSQVGVDLNRNYDFQWRMQGDEPCPDYADDVGASDDPREETYRGPRAESEPEIMALKTLTDDPNRHFRAQLDYHNYAQLILYPWGFQREAAPDAGTLSRLAELMATEMSEAERRSYRPQQAIDLYSTTGSSIDYAYGVNRIAAPLLIELRPNNGNFNVPESEIAPVNNETWAGARAILDWAVGPPILESVQAYQATEDGSFSKLVYSARWIKDADLTVGARRFVVDTRFPGLEPGRLQLRLQFSRPMNTASPPRATLGRGQHLEELSLEVTDGTEGWQKTLYQDDTWVGEALLPSDDDFSRSWRLAVAASDTAGFSLDARPDTITDYAVGTGQWRGYEDASGADSAGGADLHHLLSPSLPGGLPNIFVGTPNGGERLAAGEEYTIAWTTPNVPGFIPVEQELYLTVDDGLNYDAIARGLPGIIEKHRVVLPNVATTRARMQLLVREGVNGNVLIGYSRANFTIGANVNSAVDINFVSSEHIDATWTDSPFDDPASVASGPRKLIITLKVTNRGSTPVANPFLRVAELGRKNVLLTRDVKSKPVGGARQSIDVGIDSVLSPGETAQPRLIVGLTGKKKFVLSVDLYGVPVGGTINPGNAVTVWSGKPGTRN